MKSFFNLFKRREKTEKKVESTYMLSDSERRLILANRFQELENNLVEQDKWYPTINVAIELLKIACNERDLLNRPVNEYPAITFASGFTNVNHIFNWTNTIIDAIKQRDIIPSEITLIQYHRKRNSLTNFLTTDTNKRYPLEAFTVNLLCELTMIKQVLDDVSDPIYKDRVSANLYNLWFDICAVATTICDVEVYREQ